MLAIFPFKISTEKTGTCLEVTINSNNFVEWTLAGVVCVSSSYESSIFDIMHAVTRVDMNAKVHNIMCRRPNNIACLGMNISTVLPSKVCRTLTSSIESYNHHYL